MALKLKKIGLNNLLVRLDICTGWMYYSYQGSSMYVLFSDLKNKLLDLKKIRLCYHKSSFNLTSL